MKKILLDFKNKLFNNQRKENNIGISTILHYTDSYDRILLVIAISFALISSGLYPSAFWIYGNIVTAFVDYGILKEIKDANSIQNLSSCIKSNLSNGLNVDKAVHEYIYYYLYFGFPLMFTHFIAYLCWGFAAERTVARLRSSLFSKLIQQDLDWFDNFKSEHTNDLFMAIEKVRNGTGEKLADFLILMTRAMSCISFGLYSCWKLGLALSSVLFVSIGFFVVTIFVGKKYILKESGLNSKSASLFRHVVSTIRNVLAFGAEEFEIKKYENSLRNIEKVSIKKSLILGLTTGFSSFFNYSSYAIWIGYGTYLFRNECETFTAGNIIQTFSSIIISSLAITAAFPFVKELNEAKIAATKLFKVLKIENKVNIFDKKSGLSLKQETIKGDLSFKSVNFSYKSRPESQIIKNFNLNIGSRKTIAIIGPSGCGKSTLIKLVARLFSPASGKIEFDGHDINEFNLNWWRSQLSIVSQEPVLLNMSFRDNIRLGYTKASNQEIEEAAKYADIHNDIMSFKLGYDSIIEQGGSKMSGGQKQRISIARAFLRSKTSSLLILDEATSALDNQTEKNIQRSINKLRANKTTIIIAHRLSTIRNADLIVEMKNGFINESGTHEELMNKKGYYYNLVKENEQTPNLKEYEAVIERKNISYLSVKNKISFKKQKSENDHSNDKEEEIDRYYSFKVWSMNRNELFWIILASIAFFLNGSVYPFVAFCFSEMIKIFAILNANQNVEQTYIFTGIVIGLSVISFISTFLINYATSKSGLALTKRAKSLLFKTVVYKQIAWFDKEENKLSKLTYGMNNYPGLLKGYTVERLGLFLNFLTGVGIPVGMSLYYSWKLTLVVLIFVPFALIWGFMQGQGMRNNRKLSGLNKIDDAIECSREIVHNIQTIMTNNLQIYFKMKLDEQFKSNINRMFVIIFIEAVFYGLGYTLFFFVQCASFGYGSILIQNNELEPSHSVRIFASILFSSMFLGKTISSLSEIPKAKKAAKWYFNIIDDERDETLDLKESFSQKIDNFKGNIEFDKVKFGYSNKSTLDNINMNFSNDKSYAIVGKSGCGKSTIMSLILKYYQPTDGSILIDGIDINKLSTKWFRKQIGLVSQEFNLFDGTIKENITYGLNENEYSENDVINASVQADAHDFIMKLPDAYKTVLINGGSLSGGQKQRIALARALIRKPKILLLDEVTSALDKESENKILNTLEIIRKNKTCISITHRLNTIENCNKIYVINNKNVSEKGTHLELMNVKGYYFDLKQSELSG